MVLGIRMAVRTVGMALLLVFIAPGHTDAATPPAWACSSVWQPNGPPTTACADNSCNPRQANMGGNLLVLAAGSLDYTHGGFNSVGSNPADCCSICKTTDNCTAWNFCNRKEGCGDEGSCSNYIRSLKPTSVPYGSSAPFPLLGFGSFGSCNQDGTWPFMMCSLKQVANTSAPQVFEQGVNSKGWVSGVVPKPVTPGCPAGLTAQTCAACKASKAPQKCYSCALKVQFWGTGAASCIACSSLPTATQQDVCLSCINNTSSNSCSGCLQWVDSQTANLTASAACFDCVAAAGPNKRNNSGCVRCFNSYPQPTDMAGCLKCASNRTLSVSAAYGCASCYSQPSQYVQGCTQCLQQFNKGPATTAAANCGGCAQQSIQLQPALAKTCYTCVGNVSAQTGFYCSMQATQPTSAALMSLMPEYYKCLSQPDAVTGGGTNCYSCLTLNGDSAKCFACITVVGSNPNAPLYCNMCWNGQTKNPEKCQACLKTAGVNAYNCSDTA